jgi:hypothetical protein
VRSERQTITLIPVPREKIRKINRSSYVDRGTDAEGLMPKQEPFKPVMPITEDLVVYMKDETPDALIDGTVKGYRDGSYPIISNESDNSDSETITDQLPGTPRSQSLNDSDSTYRVTQPVEPTVASPSMSVDEYDPFAYVQTSWPPPKPMVRAPNMKVHRPPTPEKTPSPSVAEKDELFHEFKIISTQTAVMTQNSLRSILNNYFPPEGQGYCQFQFSLLPELEGLWKPVFREAEPGSPRSNSRRTDQILAIGSQKTVKKEYSSAIIGLLDKLGSKSSGVSRSGRLDFRYGTVFRWFKFTMLTGTKVPPRQRHAGFHSPAFV